MTPHLQAQLSTNSQLTLKGDELAQLLSSGQVAAIIFRKTGAIPLWNPFVGMGEPLLESPFSFVLNPLMMLPMLFMEPAQGIRISLLLHIALMGTGGWMLGRTLGLGSSGRVFLGLLLAGSGSMAAAVGAGFYQIGLSMAYIPWVLTGLIGTLTKAERWPICLLALAVMLMVFAGSFWYVLPTVLISILIVIVLLLSHRADRQSLQRLTVALILSAGLSAVRLLPLANIGLVNHAVEPLATTYDLFDIVKSYFTATTPPITGFIYNMFAYHYSLPLVFGVILLIMWGASRLFTGARWRPTYTFVIPALLIIIFFTVWAQEGTPLFRWLYRTFPILQQFRSPVRLGSMAAFWMVILAGIVLDDVIGWLRIYFHTISKATQIAARIGVGMLLLGALISALNVLINWTNVVGVGPIYRRPVEAQAVRYIREQHPDSFLSVRTEGMLGSFAFYETLSRSTTGNPNVYINGQPSTIGPNIKLDGFPEYAVAGNEYYEDQLKTEGYTADVTAPKVDGTPSLWRYENALPYAFQITPLVLKNARGNLGRQDVQPIASFIHNIDSVQIVVPSSVQGAALIVQETAYPGWTVTVNKQASHVESINGYLAVMLPESKEPLEITFSYRPPLVYIGAFITLLSVLGFVLFALRIDRLVSRLMFSR